MTPAEGGGGSSPFSFQKGGEGLQGGVVFRRPFGKDGAAKTVLGQEKVLEAGQVEVLGPRKLPAAGSFQPMGVEGLFNVPRLREGENRFSQVEGLPHQLVSRRADQGLGRGQVVEKRPPAHGEEAERTGGGPLPQTVYVDRKGAMGEGSKDPFGQGATKVGGEVA